MVGSEGRSGMPSKKTTVIEYLFDQRWDPVTRTLSESVVTKKAVADAIRASGSGLSDENTANFFKDLVRNTASANENWPSSVFARGYTGRQTTGEGQSFEFVPLKAGSKAAFEPVPPPGPNTKRHLIETASLPLASRKMGRRDESWLTQVIVRSRLVETHFSLFSSRPVVQVDHLQMQVKLRQAEIDAVFLATETAPGGAHAEFLISCEAKGKRDDILETQLLSQVGAIFASKSVSQDRIVPVAVKIVAKSEIHFVEYDEVTRHGYPNLSGLSAVRDVLYELKPPVPGIE